MQNLITVPRVVFPSILAISSAPGCFGALDVGDKGAGAPATAQMATSLSGLPEETRLGVTTMARLFASIRFVADRNDTSCKSPVMLL